MYYFKEKQNVYNYFFDFIIFIFLFFSILGYSKLIAGSSVIKIVCQVIIIVVGIKQLNIKKYLFLWPLLLTFLLMPLVLIICGIYSNNIQQIIDFVLFFLFNLLFIIIVTQKYSTNIQCFLRICFKALNLSLFLLLFLFRGLSLNIPYLVSAMVSNERYGGDLLLERYGMGFQNPNTFAMFASILLMLSIYFIVIRKYIFISFIDILFSFLCIFNSESRTPFFVIGLSILYFLILQIKNKKIKVVIELFFYLALGIFSILIIYLLVNLNNNMNSLFIVLNNITSNRLSFGQEALNTVTKFSNVLFGIGPVSGKYITNNIFGNNITLDDSFEFYLFTIGWIGLIFIYSLLIWILRKLRKEENKYLQTLGLVTFVFYFSYSLFENTIFIPNSTLSNICLIIIFSIVIRKYG